jgi:hypothetical protein
VEDFFSQKGLSSGNPDFSQTVPEGNRNKPDDFFIGHQIRFSERPQPFCRSTVYALEIAPVSYRNAEVIDAPVEGVFKGPGFF